MKNSSEVARTLRVRKAQLGTPQRYPSLFHLACASLFEVGVVEVPPQPSIRSPAHGVCGPLRSAADTLWKNRNAVGWAEILFAMGGILTRLESCIRTGSHLGLPSLDRQGGVALSLPTVLWDASRGL